MCGLVGYYSPNPRFEDNLLLTYLYKEVLVRGLHSYGLAWSYDGRANTVWRSLNFGETLDILGTLVEPRPTSLIAHTRYATSGDWRELENNQPLLVNGAALAFNGVLDQGTKEEMEARWGYRLSSYNDGELFLRALEAGHDPSKFVRETRGSFAGLYLTPKGELHVLRNERRPLWCYVDKASIFFASTRDVFRRALKVEAIEVKPGVDWTVSDVLASHIAKEEDDEWRKLS